MRSDEVHLPYGAVPLPDLSDAAFLDLLIEQDIGLRLKDGKLRINAPAGVVSDTLRAEMVKRRDFLLATCQSAREMNGTRILRSLSLPPSQAPLTYGQERLWLLERFHPGNFAYNIPEVFELKQMLDPQILQRAINTVAGRHETLRTRIVEENGRALQQVDTCVNIPLAFTDLSYLDEANRDEHLRMLLRQESRRPFNLTVAPLAHFQLYQLGPERQILFVNLHHIICDRWSTRILYRELTAAYLAHAGQHELNLPPLPIQYGDYATWERSPAQLRSQKIQYWQQQLANLPEPVALPFARPSATAQPVEGAICVVKMTPEDTAALRRLAMAQGATLYMVLLAAYCALLRRYTGAHDMCIGSPVSERNYPETEPLIGLFVNTLVMRCKAPAHASFLEVLRGVRETVLDAHAHRDVPFQQVLNNLNLEQRNSPAAGSPLFQTMLAFDPLPVEVDPNESTEVELDPGFAKFDLTLQLREEPTRIAGWFEYRTDIIDAQAISRFAAAFLRLLRGILADPAQPLESIDILAPEERRLLLHDWNATGLAFPSTTIHRLFEQQATATPDAIAVIDGNRRISYRQLNQRANRVAHTLLQQGVKVEEIVGVHHERTAEMIAALLGVLKAGAAYLPLDPHYPAARLLAMMEDSQCRLVLTDADCSQWPFEKVNAIPVPVFDESAQVADDQNPSPEVTANNLAYVIYTSGSTGKPKGVAIEHHSTVSFITWAQQAFPSQLLKGTLASTPISFDLSVFEIFVPLVSGHAVILAADILQLPQLSAVREVTLATTVPSAAAALLDAHGIPATLRAINLAGEPLTARLVDRLYKETALATVTDLYGPTETTTYSTWTTRLRRAPATIGRPIANTRIYLLDDALQLVPIGMAGELFIAGEGVARGYLHRAELTAASFVSLSHLGEMGRAYRTGDLCRYTGDGTLVYLGRMDQQVKINGFRIELEEVETNLRLHPAIEDAAVLAQREKSGSALVAAVRLKTGHTLDVDALIQHQSAALPQHMVARRIAAVPQFPRNANGKLDRVRLGAQIAETHSTQRVPVPPRDELERELLAIWQQGFLQQAIGIDDDFFQIGGHSLLALRIFSDIEARLGHRLMLSVLFQSPTVRLLAKHIRQEMPSQKSKRD